MKSSLALITLALVCTGCDPITTSSNNTLPGDSTTVADRDNTAVNERDLYSVNKTPIDQNENERDIGITSDIRKQVVDANLSITAQNVKIITQDGRVTLRGPVKSEEEKKKVEDIARSVAGESQVDSQLEIETNR
jgi:hyperosmotically inducible periplasmic protein